jgi:hypothetical protein
MVELSHTCERAADVGLLHKSRYNYIASVYFPSFNEEIHLVQKVADN